MGRAALVAQAERGVPAGRRAQVTLTSPVRPEAQVAAAAQAEREGPALNRTKATTPVQEAREAPAYRNLCGHCLCPACRRTQQRASIDVLHRAMSRQTWRRQSIRKRSLPLAR